MAEDKGLWGSLGDQYDYRTKQFDAATDLGPQDPRAYLRGAGAVAGGLGDLAAAPFEALTPAFVEEAIGEGAQWVLETKLGQYGQQLAKDNPEAAKDLGAAVNILGVIPLVRLLSKSGIGAIKGAASSPKGSSAKQRVRDTAFGGLPDFASDLARNMNTHVRGGMLGDAWDVAKKGKPAKAGDKRRSLEEIASGRNKYLGSGINFYTPAAPLAVAGEALNAVPGTLRESLSPSRLARREETGYANNFWTEAEKLNKDKDVSGLAGAELMQQQMSQGIDKIQPKLRPHGSPLEIDQRQGKPLDMHTEGDAIKKVAMKGMNKDVADKHLEHIKSIWGISSDESTKVLTMRPGKSGVAMESSGSASTGSPLLQKWENGSLLKNYENIVGYKNLTPQDRIESTQIAGAITKKNVGKLKKHFEKEKYGELIGSKPRKYSAFQRIKKSVQMEKSGVVPNEELMKVLLTARHKDSIGETLSKKEQKYLRGWEAIGNPIMQVKDYNGNVVSNVSKRDIKAPDGDYITGTGSYLSRDKEKGGVNFIWTTDLKKNETDLTTSDASDLAGYKGPEGSDNIVVVVPGQKIRHTQRGSSKAVKKNWGVNNKITNEQWKRSMDALSEAVGYPVKTTWGTEKSTHRNILKNTKPTVLPKHRKQALSNLMQQGLFATQVDNREER
tara:strand:+ start:5365 stop:7371 length:2007 start_codon:yes stop_codon:yes gene_type:complete